MVDHVGHQLADRSGRLELEVDDARRPLGDVGHLVDDLLEHRARLRVLLGCFETVVKGPMVEPTGAENLPHPFFRDLDLPTHGSLPDKACLPFGRNWMVSLVRNVLAH